MALDEAIGIIAGLKEKTEVMRAMSAASIDECDEIMGGIQSVLGTLQMSGVADLANGAAAQAQEHFREATQMLNVTIENLEAWIGILSSPGGY